MLFSPSEEKMWEEPSSKSYINQINKSSDDEINAKYEVGEQRILTEMNREKLPLFVEALKKPGYLDIQPCFQRRPRWDSLKQSKLIESFLMNIPVPPVILYQKSYGSYEVIDGQQRIVAIQDFYENKLVLHGLKIWAELNGRTYEQLPRKIKALIDRRSITYIVLITEPIANTEEALILKQLAFERINTGGIELSPQEVRNCLYYGKFNQLLLDLSRNSIFANAWGIPLNNSNNLLQNTLYTKMEDTELILRFFALRNIDNYWNGMQEFLNFYMSKALNFYDKDIEILKNIFCLTIETADKIYEDKLFKPFDPKTQTWKKKAYKAYYDAVMVGFSNHLSSADTLISRKARVIEETKKLFREDKLRLFTGGGRTKADIQERLRLFDDMLLQVIAE